MRKYGPITLALGTLALTTGPTTAQQKTLDWWTRASQAPQANALAEAYNKRGGVRIKVNPIADTQYFNKFGTAVAGGQAPDLISIGDIALPTFIQADQLLDMTAYAKSLAFLKNLSPAHMDLATSQGKIYGVPVSVDVSFLIYNKGLYKRAGLDPNKPPRTWAEVEAHSKRITALGDGVKGFYFSGACAGCNAFTFVPQVWAAGGSLLNAEGNEATVATSAPLRRALEFYRRMWTQQQVPTGAQSDNGAQFVNAFLTGKIGIMGSGSFMVAVVKKDKPDLDFGVTYLPGEKAGQWSAFSGGDAIAIPRATKNVKEAQDFITWMLSVPAQTEVVAKGGWLPVRSDVTENKYTRADPRLLLAARAAAKGRAPKTVPYTQVFDDPNGPFLAMFQQAVFRGEIDAALARTQEAFTRILRDAYQK